MIPGILIEKAVKLLASQFKLDKILKYVEEVRVTNSFIIGLCIKCNKVQKVL